MSSAVTLPGGGRLQYTQQMTEVHYESDLDRNWTYTDTAGHRHHCDYHAPDHYPTLRVVVDRTYWCEDCHDEHEDSHLECRQCGETIRPGHTGPGTICVPGLQGFTLNGYPVTKEQAAGLVAGDITAKQLLLSGEWPVQHVQRDYRGCVINGVPITDAEAETLIPGRVRG